MRILLKKTWNWNRARVLSRNYRKFTFSNIEGHTVLSGPDAERIKCQLEEQRSPHWCKWGDKAVCHQHINPVCSLQNVAHGICHECKLKKKRTQNGALTDSWQYMYWARRYIIDDYTRLDNCGSTQQYVGLNQSFPS